MLAGCGIYCCFCCDRKSVCLSVCLSVYPLFLVHRHSFERICTKFGIWHPYTHRWSRGLASAAGARGLALRAPGSSELAGGRRNRSSAVGARCDRVLKARGCGANTVYNGLINTARVIRASTDAYYVIRCIRRWRM